MTPEQEKLLNEVNERLKKVEQYTTSIGGSLEFDNIVKGTVFGSSTVGFYGVKETTQASKISDPSGGTPIDSEARTAINAIIDAIENIGISSKT